MESRIIIGGHSGHISNDDLSFSIIEDMYISDGKNVDGITLQTTKEIPVEKRDVIIDKLSSVYYTLKEIKKELEE